MNSNTDYRLNQPLSWFIGSTLVAALTLAGPIGVASFSGYTHHYSEPPSLSSRLETAKRPTSASVSATPDHLKLAGAQARVKDAYAQLPFHFEANRGQADPEAKFLARGHGYGLFLTPTEAVLQLRSQPRDRESARTPRSATLRVKLLGANHTPRVTGLDELPGKSNYFIGDDPQQWRTDVPNFGKVKYEAVWAGIDLVFYGNQQQLEYDFHLSPGADPRAIKLAFAGARKVRIAGNGELLLDIAGGEVRQHSPIVYQEVNGSRQEVAGRYVMRGRNEVGFEVASYDPSQPLVIDPILVYSTYLGGSSGESGSGIAVDSAGNAYITGATFGISNFIRKDFPTIPGAFQEFGGFAGDAFVAELDASGVLIACTYLGGSALDSGNGIAVDVSGYNVYVTGATESSNFPRVNALQRTYGGKGDAFVAKLNSGSLWPVYSTYLGGTAFDEGHAIVVDGQGNVYVTGYTETINNPFSSKDFPTTSGAFDEWGSIRDAFVAKYNPAGSALVYCTYLGGDGFDTGNGIAVNHAGEAYVTGFTGFIPGSKNFPLSDFNPLNTRGGHDAFVTKLNPTGSQPVYSVVLAGSGKDEAYAIAIDSVGCTGCAYVTGVTNSPNFPVVSSTLPFGGGNDAFVTMLSGDGATFVYSTFLGGSGLDDWGLGIAVDNYANAYVTGLTNSPNFPVRCPMQAFNGGTDAFVTVLNAAPQVIFPGQPPFTVSFAYSTFLGGSNNDSGRGIAVDGRGTAYVTGDTTSTNFPTANPWQPFNSGVRDIFVTKIATGRCRPTFP